jgi:hypothetical protein
VRYSASSSSFLATANAYVVPGVSETTLARGTFKINQYLARWSYVIQSMPELLRDGGLTAATEIISEVVASWKNERMFRSSQNGSLIPVSAVPASEPARRPVDVRVQAIVLEDDDSAAAGSVQPAKRSKPSPAPGTSRHVYTALARKHQIFMCRVVRGVVNSPLLDEAACVTWLTAKNALSGLDEEAFQQLVRVRPFYVFVHLYLI